MQGETALQIVRRHVWEGQASIKRQEGVILSLNQAGHDPYEAEKLLALFKQLQTERQAHLDRLTA